MDFGDCGVEFTSLSISSTVFSTNTYTYRSSGYSYSTTVNCAAQRYSGSSYNGSYCTGVDSTYPFDARGGSINAFSLTYVSSMVTGTGGMNTNYKTHSDRTSNYYENLSHMFTLNLGYFLSYYKSANGLCSSAPHSNSSDSAGNIMLYQSAYTNGRTGVGGAKFSSRAVLFAE